MRTPLSWLALLAIVLGVASPLAGQEESSADPVLIGGDGLYSPDFVKLGGEATQGARVLTPFVADRRFPAIRDFCERYEQAFGREPDAWSALSYDALGTLALAMRRASRQGALTRAGVREQLAAMSSPKAGYRGLTGVTWFDEEGNCGKPPAIAIVSSAGRFQLAPEQLSELEPTVIETKTQPAKGEPIYVGVAGPFAGQLKIFGDSIRGGVALKLDEINASGGIAGRPLEVIWADDQASPELARGWATKLAKNPGVYAVLGHFTSSTSNAGKPIYREAKLVQLTACSTYNDVCSGSDWTFRSIYSDEQHAHALVDSLLALRAKDVVVFYETEYYGKGLRDAFVARAKAKGLKVLRSIPYDRESALSFKSIAGKGKGAGAVVVCGLYLEGGQLARALKELGILK